MSREPTPARHSGKTSVSKTLVVFSVPQVKWDPKDGFCALRLVFGSRNMQCKLTHKSSSKVPYLRLRIDHSILCPHDLDVWNPRPSEDLEGTGTQSSEDKRAMGCRCFPNEAAQLLSSTWLTSFSTASTSSPLWQTMKTLAFLIYRLFLFFPRLPFQS